MPQTSYGALDSDGQPTKKKTVLIGVGILIALGIVLVVVGAVEYKVVRNEPIQKPEDSIGVVIDAGGSGTRLVVYSYSDKEMKQLYFEKCEEEGMSQYTEAELPVLKKALKECIDKAVKDENLPLNKQVPIFVGATAGMRLLKHRNMTMYNEIWNLVRGVIDASPLRAMKVDTVAGFDEAKWAWVAANYLKKTFQNHKTPYGTTEMGSSSSQIAFTDTKEGDASKHDDVQSVTIEGKKITLYGHSYLCFGQKEFQRRYFAKLTMDSNYSKVVKDPCLFKGFNKNVTSDYLWKPPCVSGDYAKKAFGQSITGPKGDFVIQGDGDYSRCTAQMDTIVDTSCSKSSPDCGIHKVYQPPPHGTFLALSAYYYAAKFFELSPTAGINAFVKSTKEYCGKTWSEIIAEGKAEPVKFNYAKCFDGVFSIFLLSKGFKLDNVTTRVEFTNKIGGEKVQWTMGLMYANLKTMYRRFTLMAQKITVERPAWIAMIVVGCVALVLGVGLFIFKRNDVKSSRAGA